MEDYSSEESLCISRTATRVGFYLSLQANKGAPPSPAPPLPCQPHNGISETRLVNVWDCFRSGSATTGGGPRAM